MQSEYQGGEAPKEAALDTSPSSVLAKEREVLPSDFSSAKLAGAGTGLLQEAFETFHRHAGVGHHHIAVNRIGHVLREAGINADQAEVQRVIEAIDHGNGQASILNFEQFYILFVALKLFSNLTESEDTSMSSTSTPAITSTAATARIRRANLRQALQKFNLSPHEERVEDMLSLGSKLPMYSVAQQMDEDDAVTFSQFLHVVIQAHYHHGPYKLETLLHNALRYWYTGAGLPIPGSMIGQGLTPLQDFIAGTFAGIAITLVGHPFDTIKVRLQMGQNGIFKGAIDATLKTISKEGIRGLYKGMASPMASVPLVNAIVFAAYGQAKSWLRDPEDPERDLNLWQLGAAGAWAGFVNSFVISPVELVKTRLQLQYHNSPESSVNIKQPHTNYSGPVDAIFKIVREKGPFGVMKGLSATVYREMPAYAGQFVVYELLKRWLSSFHSHGDPDELNPLELMFAGGMAGIGAWVASYPMDYVKTQLQADDCTSLREGGAGPRYRKNKLLLDGGFFDCLSQTVRGHGWGRLWHGFAPCVCRAFPANASGFLAYELAAKLLKQKQNNNNNNSE